MSHWQGTAEPLFGIAIDLTPHIVVGASPGHAPQPLGPIRPNSDMPAVKQVTQPATAVASDQGERVTIAMQPRQSSALAVGAIGLAAIAFLIVGTASRSSRAPASVASIAAQAPTSSQAPQVPTPMEPNVLLSAPSPVSAKAGTRATPSPRTRHDGSRVTVQRETGSTPAADVTPAPEPLAATLERLQSGIR